MINISLMIAILKVYENANTYFHKWYGRNNVQWLKGLKEEVEELSKVIDGEHNDSIEHELIQIAGIAANWLAYLEDQRN